MRRVLAATFSILLGVTAARGTISLYVSPSSLTATAPWVVEGTATRIGSGYDPETGALRTYVTIDVETVHRGPSDLDRLVLRLAGGSFGGLVHAVDAVATFEPGERVLLFLEPGKDGALRTASMYFGKFRVVDDGARLERDLAGHGLIVGARPVPSERESFSRREILDRLARARPIPGRPPVMRAIPPEWDRLLWDDVRPEEGAPAPSLGRSPGRDPSTLDASGGSRAAEAFVPLSTGSPTRWDEADSGAAVGVQIEPARNPMGNNAAAVAEIHRAMAAWSAVPESRVLLQSAGDNAAFTGSNAQGPADVYPPYNIVLFGDPYDDIADPSGCSGTLAIGGYWRSGSLGKTVNNVTFYPALRLYVIFNRNFECFLANADNLAEVATHELGHGLGFGHSAVSDAVMRSSAYGSRGPRLGNDDRDAAHCHYPHTLAVTAPNGGESWTAGSVRDLTWSATAEWGSDPGVVDLEFSPDAGGSWTPIAAAEPNDGSYPWTVPASATAQARVRVRRANRVDPTPAPYPSACSLDGSNANFTIAVTVAGTVPDGSGGTPLRLASAGGGALTLTWGASCSTGASEYAVYEGSLASLRAGSWDHLADTCAAGLDRSHTLTPGIGDRYFLVAPRAPTAEGRLGRSSSGALRPQAASPCAPRESSGCE